MRLVSESESAAVASRLGLHDRLGDACAGGSVCNTTAAMAAMGSSTTFLGSFGSDALGSCVVNELKERGVQCHYDQHSSSSEPTGLCVVAVADDGERTMNTFLGASASFCEEFVDYGVLRSARAVMLEGYLWDADGGRDLMEGIATECRKNGQFVVLTLSDALCVERHRDSFTDVMENCADAVFASRPELEAMCGTAHGKSLSETGCNMMKAGMARGGFLALTMSGEGALISTENAEYHIEPIEVETVVDSTGAGDLFAAGVLHGRGRGWPIERCGELGAAAASEVVSHIGTRPQTSLKELAKSYSWLAQHI